MRGCSKHQVAGIALSEFLFILTLVGALVLVGFLGRISMQEARRTEAAKEQAVKFVQWFESLSANAGEIPSAIKEQCKTAEPGDKGAPAAGGATWQTCRDALALEGGPLHGYVNPFSAEYAVFNEKCDRKNIATRGAIVVEEALKVPPGQAAVFAAMQDARQLEKELAFRVTICDKGSFPIKIGEAKL
jgi:hypothetical protein